MNKKFYSAGGVLIAMLLSILLVAGGAYGAILELAKQETAPVRHVRIEGVFQNLKKASVQIVLTPLMKGGFWFLDLKKVATAVKELPWVDQVRVDRVWPDTVRIRIDEQIPFLRWGEDGLLNQKGERFVPPSRERFESLVLIDGPQGREAELMMTLNQLQAITDRQGLKIARFIVNDQRSWVIRLSSGVELMLGAKQPMDTLSRFMSALPMMGQRREAIQRVDLRYPSGFSVSWKVIPEFEMDLVENNVVF